VALKSIRNYVCHIAVFSTGERFPVLLYRDSYQPVALPIRYIIDERRENNKSGTLARDCRVLCWFYEWCDGGGIEIEARLRAGDILTKAEIAGFCKYLRAGRRQGVVGSIGTDGARGNDRANILSPETFNSYLEVIESFLLWAAYEFIPVATPEAAVRETLEDATQRVKRAFSSNRKSGQTMSNRRGLSHEEVEAIRKVIRPEASQNPFRRSTRFRNHLMFELMLATGIRRGELLKIKLSHLPVGSKTTLSIVRSPDDKDDPRRNEPQVKTRMREIPLPRQLSVALWKYVQKHRRSDDTTYLFTSARNGAPLSSGGVNRVFSLLIMGRFPFLQGRLSPHTMRHTFNEMLVEMAVSLGWDEERIRALQRYLNGWSDSSEMPTRYTRRLIEAQAMEVAERFQRRLYDCC
jgi:integrase